MNLSKLELWDKAFDIYKINKNNLIIEEVKEIVSEFFKVFFDEY